MVVKHLMAGLNCSITNTLCDRCLAEVDTPIVAAQHASEAFVVELALVFHADLSRDRVGGGVANGGIRVDVAHLGIGAGLRDDETRRFGGYPLSLGLRQD